MMNFLRLVRGSSMGELTERDEDIIRVPDLLNRSNQVGTLLWKKLSQVYIA